jgi:hypothetical protein
MYAKLLGHESHVEALLDAGADTKTLKVCQNREMRDE